ncbi:histidinol-phosphate transaminase [Actinoalloteichus hymeniacidonis]|uniref:Aromatic amino acid aminotransferase n=1 Tax=Actinoalloteichus hymeniacidonis TaxID=340345 RepID=A0AAC9HKA7_9PSEU|nr:histidinol-phosphate transaminase [Actinoalloteichus hymeniacidonis]AOS61002.1 histidinol-phosphate aminotransferase [Actinoalloteichus hymeniacidonis]MBB5910998.1 histidinol-phosphate aminotransferase [Actinoalloteichus hymeniacidonis]
MTVRIRADLEQLPGYVPGRSLPGAVKLASNEVPFGPLPSVVEAITAVATEINRYPDNSASALIAELSGFLDVPAQQLAVGCGSVSLCQQLVQATCTSADEVLFAWRSFEAYPVLTHVVGARQVRVPLTGEHGLDLRAMADAITPATRLIFVCNPNNPTGSAVRRAELEEFLDRVPADTLVVLDEAYREFITDPDVPDGVRLAEEQFAKGRHNIAVLRTFSKAYGLAGLRVGYCYATGAIAEALRKVYVPFSVNSLAQTAAIASLRAHDQLMARCAEVAAERDRVHGALIEAGYAVPETQANFVWLPLGERTEAFNEHCLTHKIVTRPFVSDGVRVTIGTPEENDTFLAAARSFTG